jgi:putative transposase
MARGVGKCTVFLDSDDRDDFVRRLSTLVTECNISLMAWALMPNHIHLLSRTGPVPLGKFMQRLLTGYAGSFNRRYDRVGHLFQNRFKSILVQEEVYLLRLVRYIHLNPLRAGLVSDVQELCRYPWSGHGGLARTRPMPWIDSRTVLDQFDGNTDEKRASYLEYIAAVPDEEPDMSLEYGNFRLGPRGLSCITPVEGNASGHGYDILGSREFGVALLKKLDCTRGYPRRSRGIEHRDVEAVLRLIVDAYGLLEGSLASPRRTQEVVAARDLAAYALQELVGLSLSDTARVLAKTSVAVRRASERAVNAMITGNIIYENILLDIGTIMRHEV